MLAAVACPPPATAAVHELTPNGKWFDVLHGDRLKPGDEVVLAEGVYRDRRRLVMGHRGTGERPVVIRAADGARAVLHRPDARQNTINIEGGQHLVLRGLEITGGSTAIRMTRSSKHACKFVTLEQMHIHHVGGVAVTANHPGNAYEGLIFRGNHIHHTSGHGEGFYLGCNNKPDGTTPGYIFNSIVEQNYIHDLNGPKVSQGDGIEIKDGSYNNIVRDNVIHDTKYPGVIVYGTDGKPPNIVARNVVWNSGDHGIQAAAEAIVRNNITFNNRYDGIHSHTHQSAQVGNLRIVHNTIVCKRAGGAGIRISAKRLSGPIAVANNAIYAAANECAMRLPETGGPGPAVTIAGNAGTGKLIGIPAGVVRSGWNATGSRQRDLDQQCFPRTGSLLIGRADPAFAAPDDFTGNARADSRDIGAYIFKTGRKPGWSPTDPGFKTHVSTSP